jgi:phage gpG-like protein
MELSIVPAPESIAAVQRHAQILAQLVQADASLVEQIGDAIRDGFAANFAAESDGNGAPWVPLADWTRRERERGGFGATNPILVRTGEYRASWVDPGAAGHISRIELFGNGFSVIEGSSHEKAATLEAGGTTQSGHAVPARPVRFLSDEAEREIERRIFAYLTRHLP